MTVVPSGVVRVCGTDVNAWLLVDGDDLTLVDGGYPGDVAAVEDAIRSLGRRPEDVCAVLLTHAHIDHVGAADAFHRRYGTPTFTGPNEVAHARRERLEQAGPLDVARNAWRPGALSWSLRAARKGALRDVALTHAEAAADGIELDLPGRPVPVAMPGHTTGHTAYHLPAVGALLTGDGLVTGHALLRGTGPQVLPAMFHHGDPADGLAAIEGLDADLVLPGHGAALAMPVRDAVAGARL